MYAACILFNISKPMGASTDYFLNPVFGFRNHILSGFQIQIRYWFSLPPTDLQNEDNKKGL
jgi:hypothetical protein